MSTFDSLESIASCSSSHVIVVCIFRRHRVRFFFNPRGYLRDVELVTHGSALIDPLEPIALCTRHPNVIVVCISRRHRARFLLNARVAIRKDGKLVTHNSSIRCIIYCSVVAMLFVPMRSDDTNPLFISALMLHACVLPLENSS